MAIGTLDNNQMKRFLNIDFLSLLTGRLIFILLFSDILILSCKKQQVQPEESMPKKWVSQLPAGTYYCSPALSIDQKTVYIGTSAALLDIHRRDQFFVALDAETGNEIWRLPLGINEVRSSPAISSDNSIYFTVETRDPLNGAIQGDELWHISQEGASIMEV